MKTRTQILLALLSGVLVCVSFPTLIAGVHLPEMGWLGWFALVPLIVAIRGAAPRRVSGTSIPAFRARILTASGNGTRSYCITKFTEPPPALQPKQCQICFSGFTKNDGVFSL